MRRRRRCGSCSRRWMRVWRADASQGKRERGRSAGECGGSYGALASSPARQRVRARRSAGDPFAYGIRCHFARCEMLPARTPALHEARRFFTARVRRGQKILSARYFFQNGLANLMRLPCDAFAPPSTRGAPRDTLVPKCPRPDAQNPNRPAGMTASSNWPTNPVSTCRRGRLRETRSVRMRRRKM